MHQAASRTLGSWQYKLRIARPVGRVQPGTNVAVKARIGPIPNAPNQAMLEWVYIHVIHMPPEIGFVTDEVFPITALPDTPLAAMQAYSRTVFVQGQGAAEERFDQAPTQRIVRITRR
ncbi:MAG: hypothetical protein A2883_03885 [Pseudomonadales bacterium RIFCSPHIGHO2_01_FULL_64_12]|nr:MAG: hypothetical protein BCV62_21720 [Pseudomonas sp. K35]OHC21208.1 MAG: hypothetical protein A2883_03885 [Pseudomonadales bacterium RIFCSPHIGHO2_01_FULL_64_12]